MKVLFKTFSLTGANAAPGHILTALWERVGFTPFPLAEGIITLQLPPAVSPS